MRDKIAKFVTIAVLAGLCWVAAGSFCFIIYSAL